MKTVKVEFSLSVPDDMTEREIMAFVYFHLGVTGQLNGDNPMIDRDLEAIFGSVLVR